MSLTKDATKKKIREFSVTWKGATLGWVKMVDQSGVKKKYVDKTIGEVGQVVIDKVFVGYEGIVKIVFEQNADLDLMKTLLHTTVAPSPLMPSSIGDSLYANAGPLVIHPKDMASDTTQDYYYVKAVPLPTLPKSTEGKDFDGVETEWQVFPDQAQLLASPEVLVVGGVGTMPS